jgi:RNAse (barnase) inhibitor barstar
MFNLIFSKKEELFFEDEELYVEIVNVQDKESLFEQIGEKLLFPSSFNHDWNSFSECLCDLKWLDVRTVTIYHGSLSTLNDSAFNTYVNILINSIYSWIYSMDRKYFRVIFSHQDKERVLNAIKFHFQTIDDVYGIKDALHVNISDVPDKESLFDQMEEKLRFPYFGHNWDALYECITDLEWIKEKNVVISHDYLVSMPDDVLNVYVSLLIDSVYSWKYWPSRKGFEQIGFYVVFSLLDKERIKRAIRTHFSG